ncbi:transcriptional regulator, LacI family [Saccharopolyspora kobensis]|uniref:Transcriptional regulator, LacI family n=1 Tax=Saccharopolyspora kobensis TaxID=146035 RepID=A0A1H6A870_9PSEU|nr:LacI family DNA-binding transcriptional regulator [Saccharopolyspora kobensis]SEG44939.1 transcriptional regulator, LacI family [Saccharopolyspora kobensis]SFE52398.1 transcriptional regulator, LacI family [Saccharopolyspora kobensis]
MVTSRDVAQLAGVSQMTVSRVLQGSDKVAPETRQRVLTAMKEAGYRPHAAARTMRTRRTSTVGVVVADITNPFYPQLLEAVGQALDAAGQRMVLWNAPDPGGESALRALDEGTVDGLIFTTVTEGSEQLAGALRRGEPIVLLHRGLDSLDCDQVTTDNLAGGRAVADYLVATGHTRIGFLRGPELPSTSRHRERGFRDRLAELGRPLEAELTAQGGFAHDLARSAMRELLSREDPPTAVFCANDLTALGAVDGAASLNRRVPEDVWVIGYDDIAMTSWDSYDITTVRQPIAEMARTAVHLLLERVDDRSLPPRKQEFPSELVIRGSTAHTPALHTG